jgi:hypothetical protein
MLFYIELVKLARSWNNKKRIFCQYSIYVHFSNEFYKYLFEIMDLRCLYSDNIKNRRKRVVKKKDLCDSYDRSG